MSSYCIRLLFVFAVLSVGAQEVCRGPQSYDLYTSAANSAHSLSTGGNVTSLFAVPPSSSRSLGVALWVSLHAVQLPAARAVLFQLASSVDSDVLTLSWDIQNARLRLELTLSDDLTVIQVVDSAAIPLNTNHRRLVAFNIDPSEGRVSLIVDGLLVGFANSSVLTTHGFPLGGSTNTMGSMSIGASLNGSSPCVGSVSDLVVRNTQKWSEQDLRYLIAFRYPQNTVANGSCTSQCALGDSWCPVNASVFLFTKTGFSFPQSTVLGGTRYSFPTVISVTNIETRAVATNMSIMNQSWAQPISVFNCGISQRGCVGLPKMNVAFEVEFTISWSVAPQPTDYLSIRAYDDLSATFKEWITVNGSTIVGLMVANRSAVLSGVFFPSNATLLMFELTASGASNLTNSSFAGGQYCVTEISVRERSSLIVYPTSSFGGAGSGQLLEILSGLNPFTDAISIVSATLPSLSCAQLTPSQLRWPARVTSQVGWYSTTVALPDLPVDVYSICVVPNGIIAQAYTASRCNAKDPKSIFLCRFIVSYVPTTAQPLGSDWVTNLLHLGSALSDGIPNGLFNVDYFTSVGGEYQIAPQAGNSLNSLVWTEMQLASALWARPPTTLNTPLLANVEQVQYFALAVYAPHAQTFSMSVRFGNALAMWFGGAAILRMNLGVSNIPTSEADVYSTGFVAVQPGWHQLIVKLWIPPMSVTSVFSLRFEQSDGLSWSFSQPSGGGAGNNANFTNVCAIDAGANASVPCLPGNPTLSHDDCVALSCCHQSTANGTSNCFYPSGSAQPYRTDGKCGVGYPSLAGNIAQCDASNANGNGCCSKSGVCGNGYVFCDCPTCSNYYYNAIGRSNFVPWGTHVSCLRSMVVPIGFGFFSTCALSCNQNPLCTAFSLSSLAASGGDCILYTSDCSHTVVNRKVGGLFARFSSNCGFPQPRFGVMCNAVQSTISVGNMSFAECVSLCNVTTLCAGVQYRPSSRVRCSFLGKANCSTALVPASPSDVYSVFSCDGDSAGSPVPMLFTPNETTSTPVGCFADPTNSFLAQPAAAGNYGSDFIILPSATIEMCKSKCENLGASFFATTNGTVCTCGIMYDGAAASSSQCQGTPCPGNASQYCGGPGAAMLYNIGYSQAACPFGSYFFNQNCYSYHGARPGGMLNFTSARSACALVSGFALASIHSAAEAQFVSGLGFAHNHSNLMSWLGGLVAQDGSVTWVDGSPVTFTDWVAGNPVVVSHRGLVLHPTSSSPANGTWTNAFPDSTPLPFICKMSSSFQPNDVPLLLDAHTSEGAFACVPRNRASFMSSHVEAAYTMNYGSQFSGTTIPDNSLSGRRLRAVFNYTPLVSSALPFTPGGVMQYSLNFTGRFSLQAETIWDFASDVISVAVWISPSQALFTAPRSPEVFVAGRSAVGVAPSFPDLTPATAVYAWAIVLRPQEGLICFAVGLQSVCSGYNNITASLGWLHVVGQFDGSSMRIFTNGTLSGQIVASPGLNSTLHNSTQLFTVGYRGALPFLASMVYVGLMDDLRVFSQSLSDAQVRYLFRCTPYNAPSSVLYVYQGSTGVNVTLHGGGFQPGQQVVVQATACQPGNTFAGLPYTLSLIQSIDSASITLASQDLFVPSSQLANLRLCFVNSADHMFIAGSTSMVLGIVAVNTVAAPSTPPTWIINVTTSPLPAALLVSGINLQNTQVIVLSLDSQCTNIIQASMKTMMNASLDGASAVFQVANSSDVRTQSALTLCWGASLYATVFHPTKFQVIGVPHYQPPMPPPLTNSKDATTTTVIVEAVGSGLAAVALLCCGYLLYRKVNRTTSVKQCKELDTPLREVSDGAA